jgi:DNA-binding transcriptional LysR family regulator/uncharacterized membrane protein YoaK (UPF0700 family)
MEIRHLRYFIAVAELRNFTKAAEASFVAQSALSQQISRLEHELGAPLFVRGRRGAELTPAGQLLLPHARRLVADEAWARAEMRSYLGLEKGRLTIGLIQTSASGVDVVGAVAEFSRRHPGIELHIVNQTTAEMVEGVRRGPLDLAVVGVGPDELPEGLESRQLAVDQLVGVVSRKLADGLVGPVSVADLLGRGRLIQFAAGTGIRRHVDAALRRAGLEVSAPFELNQASDLLVFAALGLGVTIMPRTLTMTSVAPLAEADQPYVVLGLTDPLAVHPVTVIFEPSRLSVSAQEFVDLLIRATRNKEKRSLSAKTCVGPIVHLAPDLRCRQGLPARRPTVTVAGGTMHIGLITRHNAAQPDSGSPLGNLLPRRLWHASAGSGWGPLPELLLTLTLVTGLVDAVSILALGRVFVANMTGNVVFAGFAITGAPGFSLGASLFALAGFLVGAFLGGRMTAKVGHDHALHLRIATVSELALLAVALIVAAASGGAAATHGTLHLATGTTTFGTGIIDAVAALLAVAMGIQNAVARKLAVPDLTTTVLTMTLTGIGHDARSGRRGHVTLIRRVLVVATMLAGGVVGAELVLNVGTIVPLALATSLVAIVAGGAAVAASRPGEWRKADG